MIFAQILYTAVHGCKWFGTKSFPTVIIRFSFFLEREIVVPSYRSYFEGNLLTSCLSRSSPQCFVLRVVFALLVAKVTHGDSYSIGNKIDVPNGFIFFLKPCSEHYSHLISCLHASSRDHVSSISFSVIYCWPCGRWKSPWAALFHGQLNQHVTQILHGPRGVALLIQFYFVLRQMRLIFSFSINILKKKIFSRFLPYPSLFLMANLGQNFSV